MCPQSGGGRLDRFSRYKLKSNRLQLFFWKEKNRHPINIFIILFRQVKVEHYMYIFMIMPLRGMSGCISSGVNFFPFYLISIPLQITYVLAPLGNERRVSAGKHLFLFYFYKISLFLTLAEQRSNPFMSRFLFFYMPHLLMFTNKQHTCD